MPLKCHDDLATAYAEHWTERARSLRGRFLSTEDWEAISCNPHITDSLVRKHPEWPWDDTHLCMNPSLSWSLLRERALRAASSAACGGSDWDPYTWRILSEHPDVSVARAREFPEAPWEWEELFANPATSLEDLQAHCTRIAQEGRASGATARHYVWAAAAMNPNIPVEHMLQNLDVCWNWEEISATLPTVLDYLAKYPNLCWCAKNLSRNPHITLAYVLSTDSNLELQNIETSETTVFDAHGAPRPDAPCPPHFWDWDWRALSNNRGITPAEILARQELPWVWDLVSSHPSLTWDDVRSHRNIPWNWRSLAYHPNMTLGAVECMVAAGHAVWSQASSNPHVGWDTVEARSSESWDWHGLLRNRMDRYRDSWLARTARRWIAARRLQRFARDVTCDPAYAAARKLRALHLASPLPASPPTHPPQIPIPRIEGDEQG